MREFLVFRYNHRVPIALEAYGACGIRFEDISYGIRGCFFIRELMRPGQPVIWAVICESFRFLMVQSSNNAISSP